MGTGREGAAGAELSELVLLAAEDAIATLDTELRYTLVNPAYARLVGLSADSLIGMTTADVLPPEVVAKLEPLWARSLAGESIEIAPRWVPSIRGGPPVYVSTRARPLRAKDGTIVGVLAIVRDHSAQHKAETALEVEEQRLRMALGAARAGVWDWDLVSNEIVWSQEHEALWALTPGAFGGTFEEFARPVYPEDLVTIERALQRSIADHTDYQEEFRIVNGDGITRWIAGHGRPVYAADGTPLRMLGTVVDITARKRAEQLLDLQRQVLECAARGDSLQASIDVLALGVEAIAPSLRCSVLVLDAERRRLRHLSAPSLPDAYNQAVEGLEIGAGVGSCVAMAYTGTPTFVADIGSDERWAAFRDLALGHGLRACWSMPVMDAAQQVCATFAVYYDQPGLPTPWHKDLIGMATRTAEVVFAGAHVRRALAESEASLQRTSGLLLQSQDEERRRIARELHDTTVQNLAALQMTLTLCQRKVAADVVPLIDECIELTERSAAELRTLSYLLHPPMLDDFGLVRAIADLVSGFNARSGVHVEFDAATDVGRMTDVVELTLFRVVQESLANVRRHAASQAAAIELSSRAGHVELVIRDRGPGWTGDGDAAGPRMGVGIPGMTQRMRQIGGQLEVQFGPEGTTVVARVQVGATA